MAKKAPATPAMGRDGELSPAQLRESRLRAARRRAVFTAGLCYLLIVMLPVGFTYLSPLKDRAGDLPVNDIDAPRKFSVLDVEANAQRERSIDESSPEVWVVDIDRDSRSLQKLNSFVDLLKQNEPRNTRQLNDFVQTAIDRLGIALDPAAAGELMPRRLHSLSPPLTIEGLQVLLRMIIDDVFNVRHVVGNLGLYQAHRASGRMKLYDSHELEMIKIPSAEDLLTWPEGVERYLLSNALQRYLPGEDRQPLREAAADLLMQVIVEPDLTYSSDKTRDFRVRQLEDIEKNPIYRTFEAGELVAEKDKPLTPLQAAAVARINEMRREMIVTKLVGIMLISAIVMGFISIYMIRFRIPLQEDASGVFLHALPILLALVIGYGFVWAFDGDPRKVMVCFPAALVGLLSALVLNPRTAFVMVLASSCLFGAINDQGIDFMVLTLFAGFTAVLSSRRLRERADMIQVAWKVAFVNASVIMIFTLLEGRWQPDFLLLGIGALNAPVCVAVTLFIIWYVERRFGIVTDIKLLELTGLDHDLIRQLEEKAPGSYQHVLNVTKLAEAAAKSIGANYLLVRAGALFHDIGKMVKPKYFSENQITLEDKKAHGKLSPYMSVLIIKNHVKEGAELARRHKLPRKIVDFIPQHHGTGLIRFFYSSAMKRYEESATADPVREDDFRYPGPKPQTIETAIVLLADSVEAIAASKFTGGQVSEDEIRRVTQMAISERFSDGQFDECDLTMRHLREMREAFVRTLLARYHFRVAYPTLPKAPAPRAELTGSIAVAGPATRGEAAG
jgi:hypothetical protein